MDQKRHKGATFQTFFLFLPTKEPPQLKSTPLTKECITLYIKKRKNQLLQNASFRIVKKNMITCFFFCFAHIAPVRHPPTPLSELILSQYLNLSCFPSKKASSYKSRRVPNYTMRERLCSPTCQGGVEDTMLFFFSNRKYEVISLYEEILS